MIQSWIYHILLYIILSISILQISSFLNAKPIPRPRWWTRCRRWSSARPSGRRCLGWFTTPAPRRRWTRPMHWPGRGKPIAIQRDLATQRLAKKIGKFQVVSGVIFERETLKVFFVHVLLQILCRNDDANGRRMGGSEAEQIIIYFGEFLLQVYKLHCLPVASLVNSPFLLSPRSRHTLVLCERDWGAQEIRKLNVGFKVLSAAEIIDVTWWRCNVHLERNGLT